MGLDVYLYKCPNRTAAKALEEQCGREEDAIWARYPEYGAMTDADKDAARSACAAIKERFGLDEDGRHPDTQQIELPSTIDAEHYFKIGYFRSSYNDNGFNSVMNRRGLPGLYEVFQPGQQYELTPDWEAGRERVEDAIKECAAYLATSIGSYDAFDIEALDPFSHPTITSTEGALSRFAQELAKQRSAAFNSYSNSEGHFYLEGITVCGLLKGSKESIFGTQPLPAIYVIFKRAQNGKEDWYLTALRIVKETIDYVLSQPDKGDYYLHWSS